MILSRRFSTAVVAIVLIFFTLPLFGVRFRRNHRSFWKSAYSSPAGL
jgi:hypothetical protein